MIIHDVIQGTEPWHTLRIISRGASEASMVMGCSPYMTRTQLMHMKHTGEIEEVDARTQKRFDDGHKTEALYRVLLEEETGEEFLTITASSELIKNILASFDGITEFDDILYEHKVWNEKVAKMINSEDLTPQYYWQLEQQLYVSGADYIWFVTSDGTMEKSARMKYFPVEGRIEKLLKAWKKFDEDLAVYTPREKTAKVEGDEVANLPALKYEYSGLELTSNIKHYQEVALVMIKKSEIPPESDKDFASLGKMVKAFEVAEKFLESVGTAALNEVKTQADFQNDLVLLKKSFKSARLAAKSLFDTHNTNKKTNAVAGAEEVAFESISKLDHYDEIKGDLFGERGKPNFALVIKSLRSMDSMNAALDQAVADLEMKAEELDSNITENKEYCLVELKIIDDDFEFSGVLQFFKQPHTEAKHLMDMASDSFIARNKARDEAEADTEEYLRGTVVDENAGDPPSEPADSRPPISQTVHTSRTSGRGLGGMTFKGPDSKSNAEEFADKLGDLEDAMPGHQGTTSVPVVNDQGDNTFTKVDIGTGEEVGGHIIDRSPTPEGMASPEQLNKLKIGMNQLRDQAHKMSPTAINNFIENLKLK